MLHMGAGVLVEYSPPLLNNMLWLEAGYALDFLKLSGDDQVSYLIHDAQISASARFHLLPNKNGDPMVLGVKAGYSFFYLQNTATEGLYRYPMVYAPVFGFTARDNLIGRFTEHSFFRTLLFRLDGDFSFLPNSAGNMFAANIYFRIDYFFNDRMGIYLADRLKMHFAGGTAEIFNWIDIGFVMKLDF